MTSFKPRYLPKTLPPNTIILGIGASIFESGEDTHLVHNNIHHVTRVCIYIHIDMYTYILEKEMATHSSTLAWKIPWTEKPARLQSMGSQRVGHDQVTSLQSFHSLRTLSPEKEMATHSSILAWRIPWKRTWRAMVPGVIESWTQLK